MRLSCTTRKSMAAARRAAVAAAVAAAERRRRNKPCFIDFFVAFTQAMYLSRQNFIHVSALSSSLRVEEMISRTNSGHISFRV